VNEAGKSLSPRSLRSVTRGARESASKEGRAGDPSFFPSKQRRRRRGRKRVLLAFLLVVLSKQSVLGQSSFETDPFAARFRERANFDLKFKVPDKGGYLKLSVPAGEEGGPQGRQTFVGENVWEAEAPPGKFVTVEYQDMKLTARKVHADTAKKIVIAEGDVVFEQGGTRMTGSRLDLDLNDKVGVLTDGKVDLEGGLHLKGARLAKVGPRSFTLADGTLTACEGEKPAWFFSLSSGRVTLEDYARLKNVTFHLGGVPLLYTPYLLWPAMRDRASGFLTPGLGYNSSRGGYLGLSYFWALGRSWDSTFSADFYTKGYYGLGAEVRGQPSAGTRFEGTYYTIYDPTVTTWRWQTAGSLVSDDLAPNLRGVVKWLDFSDVNFFQDFNRNFSLVAARSVKSEAFLTYSPDPFALNLRLDREQALGLGLPNDESVITERRPVLEARMRPTPFFGQSVFLETAAQVGLLRASRGDFQPSGTYDREDFFPKISVPLSPVPWLSVQADTSGRFTSYGKSVSDDQLHLVDSRYTRELFSVGVQASGPSFSRIFDVAWGPWTKVKHVIEPRVDYEYLSDPGDLAKTPLFDEIDAISSQHVIRYGLVQRLIAKGKQGGSREIASLEITRPYYFRLPGEGTPGGPSPALTKNAPVDATLRVNATSSLNFDARATYDMHFGQLTAASLTANVAGKDWSTSLSVFDSHPVSPPPSPDVPASAQLRFGGGAYILPKRLRLDALANYDLTQGRMLESRWLLTVEAGCFKILTEYRDLRIGSTPSRDYRLALTLKNIGSFLDFTGSLP
jgi:hypothetical protein